MCGVESWLNGRGKEQSWTFFWDGGNAWSKKVGSEHQGGGRVAQDEEQREHWCNDRGSVPARASRAR